MLIAQVMRITRLVLHNTYMLAANAITAEIIFKYDLFLQHHYVLFGFIILLPHFIKVIYLVNFFPAAAVERFHIGREAYVIEYPFPVQRIGKVSERLIGSVIRVFF